MTLQNIYETKEQARKSVNDWRAAGFTARVKISSCGNYMVYVGSFGDRYRKMKRLVKNKI